MGHVSADPAAISPFEEASAFITLRVSSMRDQALHAIYELFFYQDLFMIRR
jgi:hypothetical protein